MSIPLHIKHWSDRADRDLFFTILSIKNIGVISGAEWTVIGNDMRSLGYGFTNEGCRQHFQGLRRSISDKKKRADEELNVKVADEVRTVHSVAGTGTSVLGVQTGSSAGSLPANIHGIDPTRNPIMRRPGPGRGRPRKKMGDNAKDNTTPAGLSAELLAVANGLRPLLPASVSSSTGNGSGSSSGINETGRKVSASPPQGQKRRRNQPQEAPSRIRTHAQHQQTSLAPPVHPVSRSAVSMAFSTAGIADENDGTENNPYDTEDADESDFNDQLQNKRQRLNRAALSTSSAEDGTDMAALATHSNAAFPAEYVFSPQVNDLRLIA